MKKQYMIPGIQVVKIEQHLLSDGSPDKTMGVHSKTVNDAKAVLGRSSGGWDDED